MAVNTVGTLDASVLKRIKEIVLAKFGRKRSPADREALWAKARTSLGHKCKVLRAARRAAATAATPATPEESPDRSVYM